MSQEIQNDNLDAILGASLLTSAVDHDITVKAEELKNEGGMNFKETFFEPQPGKSYKIKFIKNIEKGGESLTHRKVYKGLPDPKRRGKTFQHVSSGRADTCPALDAFFELNRRKKAGDAVAHQIIEEYMGNTNQAACLVQVLTSDVPEEIGMFRIFVFSTYGQNATIANLINTKLNPTAAQIEDGDTKEDIFNVFNSSIMNLDCVESTFEGRKVRDFTKSAWLKKQQGCFITLENGQNYQFSSEDIVNGAVRAEAQEPFKALIKELTNPKISVHNYFSYKPIGHELNTEDTEKYLKTVKEKLDEIIPVILGAKSLQEVANYGVADNSAATNDSAQTISGQSASDILKNSAPSELAGSILNDAPDASQAENTTSTPVDVPTSNSEVDNILGNM